LIIHRDLETVMNQPFDILIAQSAHIEQMGRWAGREQLDQPLEIVGRVTPARRNR